MTISSGGCLSTLTVETVWASQRAGAACQPLLRSPVDRVWQHLCPGRRIEREQPAPDHPAPRGGHRRLCAAASQDEGEIDPFAALIGHIVLGGKKRRAMTVGVDMGDQGRACRTIKHLIGQLMGAAFQDRGLVNLIPFRE